MSKLWELQLMNICHRQISWFDYRSENLRHLSKQNSNSNFADARMITTKNALTDLYIYLFGTKFAETIDTIAVRQTVVTWCRAVLFRAIKQQQKSRQNRFRKLAKAIIHTETRPNKKQKILLFAPST